MASLPTLRQGDWGPAVASLRTFLGNAGFMVADTKTEPWHSFGLQTTEAVKSFQASRALGVDGVVGPATWGALATSAGLSVVQMVAAMGLSAPTPTPSAASAGSSPAPPPASGPVTLLPVQGAAGGLAAKWAGLSGPMKFGVVAGLGLLAFGLAAGKGK